MNDHKKGYKIKRKSDSLYLAQYRTWNSVGRLWRTLQQATTALNFYTKLTNISNYDNYELIEVIIYQKENAIFNAAEALKQIGKHSEFRKKYGWPLYSLIQRLNSKNEVENYNWFVVFEKIPNHSWFEFYNSIAYSLKQLKIKRTQYRYCFPAFAIKNDDDLIRLRLAAQENIGLVISLKDVLADLPIIDFK